MRRGGLFFKYVILFVGLVTGVLVINAALDLYFVYQENRRASIEVQREKAEAAAQRVESFVREIERQVGWVAYAQFAALPAEQRRFDYNRLLRQVPAITEIVQLDRQGREQLRVSRLSMDAVGAGADRSAEPAFVEAMANKVYFGPVYYRKESEPYLTMAVAHGTGRSGVTVVEINLKLILEVISQIKIGRDGYTYVVDRQGRLIAHPDISLVLRGTDMSRLAQVAAALSPRSDDDDPVEARNRAGVSVLSAHAAIQALGWTVFVELPTLEAQQPVINAGLRTLALLVLGLVIAGLAGALLARRMVVPIRTLQAGAQRIGGGDFGHRLAIRTGDELEALADQFNRSAAVLQESYATLEQRVEDRTQELSESLKQQTATAEILEVISQSPTDVQPVLSAVASAARRFCGADDATIVLREGDELVMTEHAGTLHQLPGARIPVDMTSTAGRAVLERRTFHVPDIELLDAAEYGTAISMSRRTNVRAVLSAPMLSENEAVGAILLRKPAPGPFTPRQIELAEIFAAQAVIAIQNVRLFSELRESLDQQTATSEILQVINSSPGDVAPVFDAILEKAMLLCQASFGLFNTFDGQRFHTAATRGVPAAFEEYRKSNPADYGSGTTPARLLAGEAIVHIPDVTAGEAYKSGEPNRRALVDLGGARTLLSVALRQDDTVLGMVIIYRQDVRPFTDKQIALLQGFAAQAVIAMENARLLTEQREALEQQTASAEILQVISQSPTDVAPVMQAVARAAVRFCGAEDAHVFLREGDEMVSGPHEGPLSAHPLGYRDALNAKSTARAQSIIEARVTHLADTLSPEAEAAYALIRENSIQHGFRAQLNAPMLREGRAIGCICLRRREPGAFTPRQIELLETFAAQAVIAIENVRLFTEIQEKSRQLEIASQHKSQFLANMSHELRTPLNAIIGYTEMMADGLYGKVGEKAQGVLERVQNNGRHLLGLINDVLDLSKIEAGQLTLTVEPYSVIDMVATVLSATESLARTKGLALGSVVAPGLPTGTGDARRLTQVLLNLVGNAIKFTDSGSVEVRAIQTDDRFELSVVDSGFGIAPADQARIFDEFQQVDNSSTRKKGGTGLGLSISRKIVELHGGRIGVESEVGKGSTFKVTIPINVAPVKDAAE